MGKKRVAAARTLTRRRFLKVGGAGLAGAALLGSGAMAGCGGSEGGGGGSGELVFFTNPDTTGTMARLVEQFNERGEVQVTLREGNADTGQRFDQLRTQFQSGASDIDVILGDIIWTAQLAANGWISDLSDRFSEDTRSDFLPGSVEAITYEEKTYGMPWFTDTGLLYYRTDLLEDSGFSEPPATWDELKEMVERVIRDANLDLGFVFQGANYEGGVCNGLEFIWGHGGDALDPDDPTRVIVDSPEAVAGLAAERSMIESGITPQSVATYREDESAGSFLNGNAVFLRNWPYVYSLVGEEGESELETGQVGVSELPSGEGGPGYGTVGDQPLYINASSENQEAAWEFIRFLVEPEQQKFQALGKTLVLYTPAVALEPLGISMLSQPLRGYGCQGVQGGAQSLRDPFNLVQHPQSTEHVGRVGARSASDLEVATLFARFEQRFEQKALGGILNQPSAELTEYGVVEARIAQLQTQCEFPVNTGAYSLGRLPVGEPFGEGRRTSQVRTARESP